jgi:hypothetical protein
VSGLAQALVPPSRWEEIRLDYELHQLEPLGDAGRAEFAEKIERLTAPDAVERLMAEIEPKLEQARPQMLGARLMAFAALQVAVSSPDSKLTDEQRAALRSVLPGLQLWVGSTDFLSSATMRRALTLLTDAVRGSGLRDIDEIRALPLETALDRAGPVLAAAKQALALYGIDIDAVADSLRVELLEIDGDSARVRTTVTLFNAPIWSEHELERVDGRWFGKGAARHWRLARGAGHRG